LVSFRDLLEAVLGSGVFGVLVRVPGTEKIVTFTIFNHCRIPLVMKHRLRFVVAVVATVEVAQWQWIAIAIAAAVAEGKEEVEERENEEARGEKRGGERLGGKGEEEEEELNEEEGKGKEKKKPEEEGDGEEKEGAETIVEPACNRPFGLAPLSPSARSPDTHSRSYPDSLQPPTAQSLKYL
jgi:hypothetical protein